MVERQVDVAIIGTGTAGMGAYRAAREHTDSLALIEGDQYGTTCARVGCMPSKLLIAAAESAREIEKAPGFGVHVDGSVRVEGTEVMRRVREERDRFVGFVIETVEEWDPAHRIMARASFVDDHTLKLSNGDTLRADRVVIATGSKSFCPPFLHAAGDRMITSDDVFYWEDLPDSVVVFGAGAIGVELGQALARLGVRVRLFGHGGSIGRLSDPEVKASAIKALQDELAFDPDPNVTSVEREGDEILVRFVENGEELEERFDYVLAATGRRANLEGLALGNTSLELNDSGVPRFNRYTMQCSDSHIFIAGDVDGDIALLHEAADQGRIAGNNAGRYPNIRVGLRRSPIGVVFTEPNIATVGQSYRELDASGCDFAIGQVSFADQGRSRVMLENKGLLRVYAEHGSALFLGAEMVGPRTEHLAHLLSWAHQKRMTVPEMLEMPFYHPVIEEGLRTALRDLNTHLNVAPSRVKHSMDCGPGS